MKQWKIMSEAGVEMGVYPGESAADALDAMAQDAGYADEKAASAVVGPFAGSVTECIKIGFSGDSVYPRDLGLYLDPEASEVRAFYADGNAVPIRVWEGRYIRIPCSRDAVAGSVAEILAGKRAQRLLMVIRNGSRSAREMVIDDLADILSDADCYIDASEFVGEARQEIVRQMREALAAGSDADAVVDDQTAELMACAPEKCHLVPDEVESEIRKLLADARADA